MKMEISETERDVLLDLLQSELGRLKAEINRTEAHDFKIDLKAREAALQAVIERLTALMAGG